MEPLPQIVYEWKSEHVASVHPFLHRLWLFLDRGLCYVVIYDKDSLQAVWVQEYRWEATLDKNFFEGLKTILLTNTLLTHVQKHQVLIRSKLCSVIPHNFYREAPENAWLGNKNTQMLQYAYNLLPQNMELVWECSQGVQQLLNATLQNPAIFPAEGVWLKYLIINAAETLPKVHLMLSSHLLSIARVYHGQLQFFNNFSFENDDECCYFILRVFHLLQMNPSTDLLVISAGLEKDSALHKQLENYFGNIQFMHEQIIWQNAPDIFQLLSPSLQQA